MIVWHTRCILILLPHETNFIKYIYHIFHQNIYQHVYSLTTGITSGKVAQIIDLSAACADVRYNT